MTLWSLSAYAGSGHGVHDFGKNITQNQSCEHAKLKATKNLIENELGKKSKKKFLKLQDGDIIKTQANINNLLHLTKNNNFTDINTGVKSFIKWYQEFYIDRKYDL